MAGVEKYSQPVSMVNRTRSQQWLDEIPYNAGYKDTQSLQYVDEGSVYSEIASQPSPWLQGHSRATAGKTKDNPGQAYPEKSPPSYPGYASKGFSHGFRTNSGYTPSVGDSASGHPHVHKPEDFLNNMQSRESYSVQFVPGRPCGRCTRVVTALLVVMGLAVVALAAALTASILTKNSKL
jgi:hypothetical protein